MPSEMADEVHGRPAGDDIGALWRRAETVLPQGWRLDSLRCASASLVAHDRSDRWIAVAIDDVGNERRAEADTPAAAIDSLAK